MLPLGNAILDALMVGSISVGELPGSLYSTSKVFKTLFLILIFRVEFFSGFMVLVIFLKFTCVISMVVLKLLNER